ncbi:MAG: MFS transporter [Deltaproteobacteria bacterium]|nr:MFS transporter [Deltaproteobacteria bacterium]MBW2119812.1 MFS transporter [Deltaproteobacteria bacterium]
MNANTRKEKFGWCVYDWANSAFATTIMAAVLPVYFAGSIVPQKGVEVSFMGFSWCLSATSLWGYVSGLTAFLVLITAPVLGGIADYGNRKKTFLMAFCYSGSLFTALFFFSGPGSVFYTLFLFFLAHYCFVGGNVFYDAFLPFLSKGKDMDRLSGQGFALGYLGGGILLALNVLFIQFSRELGIDKGTAVRLSLTSAGVWWGLFGTIAFLLFREEKSSRVEHMGIIRASAKGLQETWETAKMVSKYRHILIFLLAYMIYNDGVQTVIKMASIYGKDELGLSTGTLLGTLLMVQFIGIAGALLMSRIALWFGTKKTIMGCLLIWLGLTIFAYGMNTSQEYWLLGIVVGLVLGGTQALSRSLYGRLIPKEHAAQFFGYFSVFAKFSAIWGPIIFAFIRQVTGTARFSILSLSLFFLIGWILLFFVREKGPGTVSEF